MTDPVFDAALTLFRSKGYGNIALADIARAAHVDLAALSAQYVDKEALLGAMLKNYSPADDFEAAIRAVPAGSAEEMLREAMRQMAEVARTHEFFFDLAVIDAQVNNGTALTALSTRLLPSATGLLKRLRDTDQMRPVSDLIVARTLISLLMGYVVSERAMPQMARMALRLFPPRAWIDGMVDLLLYGLLEDDAR